MAHNVWVIGYGDLTIRMLLAAVLGGLIGFEREWSNHPAGLRTHILVCMGSAAIMLLSMYGFSEYANEYNVRMDPARLAAQVISGIGFLGAGAILRNGSTVSGLTTAASIWVVAAIGLCAGAGFYYGAALVTLLVLISLFVLNKWEQSLFRSRKRKREIVVRVQEKPGMLGKIATMFGEQEVQIVNVKMKIHEPEEEGEYPVMEFRFQVKPASTDKLLAAIENISRIDGTVSLDSGTLLAAAKAKTKSKSKTKSASM